MNKQLKLSKQLQSKPIVISLGGSLIIRKSGFNTELLLGLKSFLKNKSFVVVSGGGLTARHYQKALLDLGIKDSKALDLIGIKATELNAFLVSKILNAELLSYNMFRNKNRQSKQGRTKQGKVKKIRIISYGLRPGLTTDYVSVLFAKSLGVKVIINMSRIRFVRDKKHDDKILRKLSWKEYFDLIPRKNTPGIKVPFDVEASKLAFKNKISVVFINTIKDLDLFFKKGIVNGTIIHP